MYYELSCLDFRTCKYYALRWQSCCARLVSVEKGYTVNLGSQGSDFAGPSGRAV